MDGLALVDVIKIAAGSGVVAAGVNQMIQWAKDRRKQSEEAKYCAVRLIGKLERFALACADEATWYERIFAQGNNENMCTLPEMTWLEDCLGPLDPRIGSQVAWLNTETSLAYGRVRENMESDHDLDGQAVDCITVVGYIGYRAADLADQIRMKYKLPSLVSEWSLKDHKVHLARYRDRAKKHLT